MNYYKIILNNQITDVVKSYYFLKYQIQNNTLLYCPKDEAQYIQAQNEKLYHADWMGRITTEKFPYEEAKIEEISEKEYSELNALLNEGKDIYIPEEVDTFTSIENIEFEEAQQAKEIKLSEISLFCKKTIQDGFDATLSNNQTYHFSLGIIDQLNITRLYHRALTEETFLPYHADGLLCEIFSKEDIYTIYEKMEEVINYHTIYHNSLKNYVLSLENTQDIKVVKYGMDIPVEYQSEVFKNLLGK